MAGSRIRTRSLTRMKKYSVSWPILLFLLIGAFLLGGLAAPHFPPYKLVRLNDGNDLRGQPVPDSDLPDNLKTQPKDIADASDLPYPAPPCKGGAKTCNAWEREWQPGATMPAGAIVDANGTVWPKGKQ
jgi:hypothetical protein